MPKEQGFFTKGHLSKIMKYRLLFVFWIWSSLLSAQTLQLHYDARHTLDPARNASNFPTIYFEYFKAKDTSGAFFIKMESDLNGANHNVYWGKGFWNYKFEFSGDIELYTQNRNLGDSYTTNLKGKTVSFFGEPQVWFKIHNGFSLGSKINLYYHVLTSENLLQVYPTLAARFKFN